MKQIKIVNVLAVALVLGVWASTLRAEPFTAQAAVRRTEVFVGESFQLQIQVSGSEEPSPPEFPALPGLTARYLGGQKNSSQSISIINGKMQREVRKGYVFAYELTPTEAGVMVIPSLSVRSDGRVVQTQPVSIDVKQPLESDDFHLQLRLSKESAYVGEPVTLTVTWYLGQDVRGFQVNLPVLDEPAVLHADPDVDTSTGGPYYRIPLGDGEAIGVKGRGRWAGKEYATITFRKVLVPRKPGPLVIEPAVIVCEALAGYRDKQRGGFFDDDFMSGFFSDDFFGRRRQGVYRRVTVASNALKLDALPLPVEGRPDGFVGHVGRYRLETSATPTEVRVGDPITLTMTLSGPEVLAHVPPPPLQKHRALAGAFKIPAEMAPGKVVDGKKVFTQTLRAVRADVEAIPPLELAYFDVLQGTYTVARSDAIPLTVARAKVLTADDAEGREVTVAPGRALEGWTAGIAHSYEGPDLLVDRSAGIDAWARSPWRLAGLLVPPVLFVAVALGRFVRDRRRADPGAVRARNALRTLRRRLENDAQADPPGTTALGGLRAYLADKLGIASSALTWADVRPRLEQKKVDAATLEALRQVFQDCEAGSYAGVRAATADELAQRTLSVARRLERQL